MSATLSVYIMTPDLEGLRRFYEAGLGARAGERSGNWVPFELAGATFALHAAQPDGEEGLQQVSYGFGVGDVDAALARFEGAGAKVLRGVADESYGRKATLEDPDGRVFEIVQYEL